jgi:hypothetical protein
MPSAALPPVLADGADDRAVVDAGESPPVDGPIAFTGRGSIERATKASSLGRDAAVLVDSLT